MHFLTEFDLHLVDLAFVRMCLRGVDESLFPIIALKFLCKVLGKLQGLNAIYTNGSNTKRLVEIGIFLDDRNSYRLYCLDTVVFSLLKCTLFILPVTKLNLNRWVQTLFSQIALHLLRD
jgi:hypothetical protein